MQSSPEWLPPQPATEPAAPPPWEEQRVPLLKRILGPFAVVLACSPSSAKVKSFVAVKGAKFLPRRRRRCSSRSPPTR